MAASAREGSVKKAALLNSSRGTSSKKSLHDPAENTIRNRTDMRYGLDNHSGNRKLGGVGVLKLFTVRGLKGEVYAEGEGSGGWILEEKDVLAELPAVGGTLRVEPLELIRMQDE